MPDLSSYTSVRTSLFVRLQIDEYRTTSSGAYTSQVLRFSDHYQNFTIDSETYTPLGELLTITKSVSEIRPTSNNVTVSISGIPTDNLAEIIHSKIKGSPIKIYRAYFDVSTNVQIGNTEGRYIGSVNNFSLEEEYDALDKSASNIIQLECASTVDVLSKTIAGRKTNSESMKKYFASDVSFDNVSALMGSSFDFGVPK